MTQNNTRAPQSSAPEPDPSAGETASQDTTPTDEDLRLEALQAAGGPDAVGVGDYLEAERRFRPGLDVEREGDPDIEAPGKDADDAIGTEDA